MDWFKIRKGVHQGCILSPCLFIFCEEYIMRNARLDEAQAADDTTLMIESEKESKSLLMSKRRVKTCFKIQHSKN